MCATIEALVTETHADCLICRKSEWRVQTSLYCESIIFDIPTNILMYLLRCETCKLLSYVLAGRILVDMPQVSVPTLMFEWLVRLILAYLDRKSLHLRIEQTRIWT